MRLQKLKRQPQKSEPRRQNNQRVMTVIEHLETLFSIEWVRQKKTAS